MVASKGCHGSVKGGVGGGSWYHHGSVGGV